jgi:hypothetical protein
MNFRYLSILVACFLLLAVLELPYGYYTLLRIIVCIYSALIAVLAYTQDKRFWVIPLALIALLFNPLMPIYFDKEIWIVLDIVVAVFYLIFSFIGPIKLKPSR